MPHRFQISRDSQALFITLTTKNRLPVFRTDEMKVVFCRAIDEARTSAGFLLFAYVIMVDHLHVLTDKPTTVSDALRVLKGITARRIIDYLKEKNYLVSLAKLQHQERERNHRYSLWQTEKNVFPIFSEGDVYAEGELYSSESCRRRTGEPGSGLPLVQRAHLARLCVRG